MKFGPRAAWGVVLGLCGGAVEVSCAGDWVNSSGGMVLEVLGDWSTGVAAAETVADAGVSVSGASHGVVGWSGGWSAEHDQHQPPCMTRDIAFELFALRIIQLLTHKSSCRIHTFSGGPLRNHANPNSVCGREWARCCNERGSKI